MSIIKPPDLLGQLSIADMDKLMKESYIGGKSISEQIFERNYLNQVNFVMAPNQKKMCEAVLASREFFQGSSLPHIMPWMAHRPIFREFLWGPNGEWTGLLRTDDFKVFDQMDYGESYEMVISNTRNSYGSNLALPFKGRAAYENRWMGWDERISHGFLNGTASSIAMYDPKVAVFFDNYQSMMEYTRYVGARSPAVPIILEMASFIQYLDLNASIIAQWSDAMMRPKYKYCYGALRDGKDRFSPLGVMLDFMDCEWVWDHDDAEWNAVDCDENNVISSSRARSLFKIPSGISNNSVEFGIQLLTDVSDKFSDFGRFCEYLKLADEIVGDRQQIVRRAFDSNPDQHRYRMADQISLVRPETLFWNSKV